MLMDRSRVRQPAPGAPQGLSPLACRLKDSPLHFMSGPVHNVLNCTKAGASPVSISNLTRGCPQIPEAPVQAGDGP